MKTVTLITGGFDPIHSGHIEYINHAKKTSDYLVVGINSNEWLINKKGYYFLSWEERSYIINNLKNVDQVIDFNDADGSAIEAIKKCLEFSDKVVFANGGDRGKENTPEVLAFTDDKRVQFLYSVGGSDKKNSSSWILDSFIKDYMSQKFSINTDDFILIDAPWGNHLSLIDDNGYKLKQLNVDPGGILSLQRHQHRFEHWIIAQGEATVEIDGIKKTYIAGEYVFIPLHAIHRLSNLHKSEKLVVIEVQCGDILEESDIERFEDSYGRASSS
jgi:cytidyltransferase-like protein